MTRKIRSVATLALCAAAAALTLAPGDGSGIVHGVITAALMWLAYMLGSAERTDAVGDARLHERTRIARILHDSFLQSIQNLLLRLGLTAARLPAGTRERRELELALDIATRAVEEGRDLLLELRTPRLAADLPAAIRHSARQLHNADAIPITVHSNGPALDLAPAACGEVMGIAREAMTNALRHARARHITVTLDWSAGALMLVVVDDGIGVPAHVLQQASDAHWGLTGMRERAQLIGASLHLGPRDQGGSEVLLLVPCTPPASPPDTWPAAPGKTVSS
ncbi:MAG: ATP-binding protein [Duganella sp.]